MARLFLGQVPVSNKRLKKGIDLSQEDRNGMHQGLICTNSMRMHDYTPLLQLFSIARVLSSGDVEFSYSREGI